MNALFLHDQRAALERAIPDRLEESIPGSVAGAGKANLSLMACPGPVVIDLALRDARSLAVFENDHSDHEDRIRAACESETRAAAFVDEDQHKASLQPGGLEPEEAFVVET